MQPSLLLTDFYQLSMAYGYWLLGMHDRNAVFHLFFRRNLHFSRYTVAVGLSELISVLQQFQFTERDIDYLRHILNNEKKPYFSEDFLSYLKALTFTGDIDA